MVLLFIGATIIIIFCLIGMLNKSLSEKEINYMNKIKNHFENEIKNQISKDIIIIIKNVEFGRLEKSYNYNQEWKIISESNPIREMYYSIKIDFQNKFDKTIKYITFHVVPFDRVYEPLTCTNFYDNSQMARLKYTGPIYENEIVKDAIWETVVYSRILHDFLIKKIEIIFLDESEEFVKNDFIETLEDFLEDAHNFDEDQYYIAKNLGWTE